MIHLRIMRFLFILILFFMQLPLSGQEGITLDTYDLFSNGSAADDGSILLDMEDDSLLSGGWGRLERDHFRSFRWIIGEEASIILPERERPFISLLICLRGFVTDSETPQRVNLRYNGQHIGSFHCKQNWADYCVETPPLRGGILSFHFSGTYMPAKYVDGSSDSRELAAAVDYIRLAPYPQEALSSPGQQAPRTRPYWSKGKDILVFPPATFMETELAFFPSSRLILSATSPLSVMVDGNSEIVAKDIEIDAKTLSFSRVILRIENTSEKKFVRLKAIMTGPVPRSKKPFTIVFLHLRGIFEEDLMLFTKVRGSLNSGWVNRNVFLKTAGLRSQLSVSFPPPSPPLMNLLLAEKVRPVAFHLDSRGWESMLQEARKQIFHSGKARFVRLHFGDMISNGIVPTQFESVRFWLDDQGPFQFQAGGPVVIRLLVDPGKRMYELRREDETGWSGGFQLDSLSVSDPLIQVRTGPGWRTGREGQWMVHKAAIQVTSEREKAHMVNLAFRGRSRLHPGYRKEAKQVRIKMLDHWLVELDSELRGSGVPFFLLMYVDFPAGEKTFFAQSRVLNDTVPPGVKKLVSDLN